MIRYALKCPKGHRFESWFQSADAYEALAAAGHVACPECGATGVEKSLMTPDVRPARSAAAPAEETPDPDEERAKALAELKRKVESESDYVGDAFVREARAIHEGAAPDRPIYGEAKAREVIELIEDDIPVAPLPFTPTRKTN